MDKTASIIYELLRYPSNRDTAAAVYLDLATIFMDSEPKMARLLISMADAVRANDAVAMLQSNRKMKLHLEQRQGS